MFTWEILAGTLPVTLHSAENNVLDTSKHVVEEVRRRGQWADTFRQGAGGVSGVCFSQRQVGVWEPIVLKVVVLADACPPGVMHVRQGLLPFHRMQHECVRALQGDGGDIAQRAQTHPGNSEYFGILRCRTVHHVAGSVHQCQGLNLGGDATILQLRAVRAGGDGTGYGLLVNVAKIFHGQAVGCQQGWNLMQTGAAGERGELGCAVNLEQPAGPSRHT